MADALHALMTGPLGCSRYLVAGGDWGASIAVRLAYAYPSCVQALHLYMMPLRRLETWPASEEQSRRALEHWLDEEGGYIHIQGTRPQTLAYGLHDSPVGLMTWIAEKFDRWTDAHGLPLDDLLTTVMLYWITGCIGSSFWPYYARRHGEWVLDDVAAAGERITAPLTYLDFPKELVHVPQAVVERVFSIERWETPTYGGHFPALEATEVLAESLRRFTSH
jgi:pimeloyl-ACP methyl ester carboxylesterase